ncbi:ubiquitin-like modifier-activating enzyme 6 [Argonauta hians]
MSMDTEIDDSLYSRQRYVLGDTAMKKMAQTSVLLYGVGGLGIEIAKNIVLAGIKSLTIHDDKISSVADLGTQFFLRLDDVTSGLKRDEACCKRIAELNPYVSVSTTSVSIKDSTDLSFLTEYQCVILTETPLDIQRKVNEFCRQQDPPIKFISGDVFGVFAGCFCDFGEEFEIVDGNGEEPKELFIGNITKDNPGVVSCLENTRHNLQTDEKITFKEVKGMTALNGEVCTVKVMNPFTFSICDTSGAEYEEYEQGGICVQLKLPEKGHHGSLDTQLTKPDLLTPDLSKINAPASIHCGFLALHSFSQLNGRLPNARCPEDAQLLLTKAKEISSSMPDQVELDENLLKSLSFTCRGSLPPLCAVLGGFMAQEVLKALTGKFTPLSQWFYVDVTDVFAENQACDSSFLPKNDRYDSLRLCIGEETLQILQKIRLFMVGCGAIGCEMLKNFALLGLGTEDNGLITITDNDLIEKSNLNRQFLFRPHHIRNPKSTTAANSVLEINPALKIEAHQNKVCPQTENTIYTDAFFEKQNVVINALDNVEARRYMDSRCVSNQRALLESGTMGTKGHVQCIVPHLTESYSNQNDPHDEEIPYCTLKSFPANIQHCIQWARDKFESSFNQKPSLVNKFWSNNESAVIVAERLLNGEQIEGAYLVSRVLRNAPQDWQQCVSMARCKFEKYFNHKAKHLLHAFPLDTKLSNGGLFWQSPKRPPQPLQFDPNNPTHMTFIASTSRLYADIHRIPWTGKELEKESLLVHLDQVEVSQFKASHKQIETDETAKKTAAEDMASTDESQLAVEFMTQVAVPNNLTVIEFEKDDDTNGHIDFITTAANLRASMYDIENADRLKVKRIAGRIVPAIATTTATVSGLVAVELLKVVNQQPLEKYRNCFLNLALPMMLLSEPGAAETMKINDELSLTVWDRWEIEGNKDFTLEMFLAHFKEKTGYNASMIVHGAKMIYVPILPGHKKRLPQSMVKLIKPLSQQKYVDLIVSLESDRAEEEDIPGPPLRYHFGQ